MNSIMVGLTNPDGVSCSDGDCDGKLKWEDGSDFSFSLFQKIDSSSDSIWFSFNTNTNFHGKKTHDTEEFACMSSCKGKTDKRV